MTYMPQMKYMLANVASTGNSDPAAKRMKLSWPELMSLSSSISSAAGIFGAGNVATTAGNGSSYEISPDSIPAHYYNTYYADYFSP